MSHASSGGGRLHATPTRKQLGDGEAKQRRVAYGSDVIKDELRKGAGGPQGAGPEQVGDSSEDEDEEVSAAGRRESITRYVCSDLCLYACECTRQRFSCHRKNSHSYSSMLFFCMLLLHLLCFAGVLNSHTTLL